MQREFNENMAIFLAAMMHRPGVAVRLKRGHVRDVDAAEGRVHPGPLRQGDIRLCCLPTAVSAAEGIPDAAVMLSRQR
jgi:hypothetical protein